MTKKSISTALTLGFVAFTFSIASAADQRPCFWSEWDSCPAGYYFNGKTQRFPDKGLMQGCCPKEIKGSAGPSPVLQGYRDCQAKGGSWDADDKQCHMPKEKKKKGKKTKH